MTARTHRLTAFPRLHLSLIDCGTATPRAFGGVGVSIDGPPTVLTATRARTVGFSHGPALEKRTLAHVARLIRTFGSQFGAPRVAIHLESMPPEHVGLGTKTSLLLGIAQLLDVSAGTIADPDQLALLTERGGTSGIGTNAYFTGGWIADAGHRRTASTQLVPSSLQKVERRAPVVFRHPVTRDWVFHCLIPSGIRLSGRAESDFFRKNTPLPEKAVLNALALVHHGVLPSIVEASLSSLGSALIDLQRTGFKRRELLAQPPSVRRCLADLHDAGFAAGMSSMGPLLFAITSRDKSCREDVEAIADRHSAVFAGTFGGRNRGSELEAIQ